MGPELGALHYELYGEVAWVHLKWQRYRALFADGQDGVVLLNRAAPAFFGAIQDIMWEDVLLHLARLSDPPATNGQQNLTVTRLLSLIREPTLRPEVAQLTEAVLTQTGFARDWRNKRLAHRRLPDAAGGASHTLAPASRLAVERALAAFRDLLNRLENHFRDSTVMYQDVIEPLGDVRSLFGVLERGTAQRDRREES